MKGTFGESLLHKTPSKDSSETLFQEKHDRGESLIRKPMSLPILDEAEIKASHKRRGHANSFFRTYR